MSWTDRKQNNIGLQHCLFEHLFICIVCFLMWFPFWLAVHGAPVVWHLSLPLINSFNKTKAAIFPCKQCFLRAFPAISLIVKYRFFTPEHTVRRLLTWQTHTETLIENIFCRVVWSSFNIFSSLCNSFKLVIYHTADAWTKVGSVQDLKVNNYIIYRFSPRPCPNKGQCAELCLTRCTCLQK